MAASEIAYLSLYLAIPVHEWVSLSDVQSIISITQAFQRTNIKPSLRLSRITSGVDQTLSGLATHFYDSSFQDSDLFLVMIPGSNLEVNLEILIQLIQSPGDLIFHSDSLFLLKKSILKKIYSHLQQIYPPSGRISIDSDNNTRTIPFFHPFFRMGEWLTGLSAIKFLVEQVNGSVIWPFEKQIERISFKGWSERSIVFYSGNTSEKWSPVSPDLGGAETSIVELSQRWNDRGWEVTVYGSFTEEESSGVRYLSSDKFSPHDNFNILVLWRCPEMGLKIGGAKMLIADLHDLDYPKLNPEVIRVIDRFFVKSQYQLERLKLPAEKSYIIPNGGSVHHPESSSIPSNRDLNKLIWCSSYDRGLLEVLKWGWPVIEKEVPEAELHIYYGWEGYNRAHRYALRDPDSRQSLFKREVMDLIRRSDRVIEHGRVTRSDLITQMKSSNICYYPGYEEIDCMVVREAASAGCIPIVCHHSAFSDMERGYLTRVPGDPRERSTQELAAEKVIQMLKNNSEDRREIIQNHPRLKEETWDRIAGRWLEAIQK